MFRKDLDNTPLPVHTYLAEVEAGPRVNFMLLSRTVAHLYRPEG